MQILDNLPRAFTKCAVPAILGFVLCGCSIGESPLSTASIPTSGETNTRMMVGHRSVSEFTLVSFPQIVLTPAESAAALSLREQLARDLNTVAGKNDIALIVNGNAEPYVIRGYVMANRQPKGITVTQIWDVIAQDGTRLERSVHEDVVAGVPPGADLWSGAAGLKTMDMAQRAVGALRASIVRRPPAVAGVQAAR